MTNGQSMAKLCSECKYSKKLTNYWCENPIVTGVSVVDGDVNAVKCINARSEKFIPYEGVSCGPDAKYFEQKPKTLWQKLKEFFNAKS